MNTDPLSKFSDPLAEYCRKKLSTTYNISSVPITYPVGYVMTNANKELGNAIASPENYTVQASSPSPLFIDLSKYENLKDANDIISQKAGEVAKQAYYEFSRLPKPFINVSAIRLANIFESNGISFSPYGYLRKKSNYVFNFLDLGGAPGGFSQYLLWKYPNATGLGVSLDKGLKWLTKDLPMDRLKLWTKETGKTGNVLLEWNDIGPYAAKNYGIPGRDYGLDLVLGGVTPEIGGGNNKAPKTEAYMGAIILSESIIALEALRSKGIFILQVYDTVTEFSADVLYLLHLVFEEVVLFRPTTVPFYNAEKYVICKNYIGLDKSKNVLGVMKHAMKYVNIMMIQESMPHLIYGSPPKMPNRLFKNNIPNNFVKYLYGWNMKNLNFMLKAVGDVVDKIILLMESLQGIDPDNANEISLALERMSYGDMKARIPANRRYNINRALIYLNLPDVVVHNVPTYTYPTYNGDIVPTHDSDVLNLGNLPCGSLPCLGGKCPI